MLSQCGSLLVIPALEGEGGKGLVEQASLAKLADLVISGFEGDTLPQNIRWGMIKEDLMPTSGFYMHTHAHLSPHLRMNSHMCGNTH